MFVFILVFTAVLNAFLWSCRCINGLFKVSSRVFSKSETVRKDIFLMFETFFAVSPTTPESGEANAYISLEALKSLSGQIIVGLWKFLTMNVSFLMGLDVCMWQTVFNIVALMSSNDSFAAMKSFEVNYIV